MEARYTRYLDRIEAHLATYFTGESSSLHQAMNYSLLAGGKRIRPVLVLEFCRISGGDPETALPLAAAVEMVHTYSLIHDDLPAMDDDAVRRGKPTCHIQFGEAAAILAGDALQAAAFQAVLAAALPARARADAGLILARCAGAAGMVAGQTLDLLGETRPLSAAELEQVHLLKTAAMIQAACTMGVLAGGGGGPQLAAAREFGEALGVAFQIRDDILDCTADPSVLGKPVGSDIASGKTTYVTLHGQETAERHLAERTAAAKRALDGVFDDTGFLLELADWLLKRVY